MNNKIYLIALLVFGCTLNSCDSDDLEYQSEFETSKKYWLDFKESSNNSYKYTVTNSSWVGNSSKTTISIKNGAVVQRDFELNIVEGTSEYNEFDEIEWTETGSEIGTHENGADPITLDEIYDKAQNEWLIERSNTTTYFETENNGMISTCGYVYDNCADDCFIGVNIKNIEAL
ncbi:hypothetical protein JM658_16460, partial [Joostella atrarenae]